MENHYYSFYRDKGLCLFLAALLCSTIAFGQQVVTGRVADQKGTPLPGLSVKLKNTTTGTLTDANGNFSIPVPDLKGILSFAYIGYTTQEVNVNGRSRIDVTLAEEVTSLNEVVVVGYGTQKKVNLTGSVSSVSAEQLTMRPVGQTSAALQGMAPGVTVTQSSGRPGADAGAIRIRGIGTIGSAVPLVLIDGIEGSINSIDPNLIESVSVLKDAASSAIYGSRAANGVILVTTKRAKSNQMGISYNAYMGTQNPTNLPDMVNAVDHMEITNAAYRNAGLPQLYSDDLIQRYRTEGPSNPDQYPDTDWQNEVLKGSGFMQSHFLSINGGGDKIRFLTSLGYLDQKGILMNTDYKRLTLRNNADITFSDKLSMRLDLQLLTSTTRQPGPGTSSIFHWMNRIPANQPGLFTNGNYGEGWNGVNPISQTEVGGLRKSNDPYASLNASINYRPFKWLSAEFTAAPKLAGSFDNFFTKAITTYNPDGSVHNISPALSDLSESSSKSLYHNFRASVTAEKGFGNHNLKALAGASREDYRNDILTAYREGFILPDYPILNTGSASTQQNSGTASEWALQSFFGRINYDFKQKYLLEVNGRYDGSSRFFTGNKYGFFPSVSAGWRISEESFMAPFKNVISNLKLRGSWGRLGNQDIGTYPFTTTVSSGSYTMNKQVVNIAALNTLANEDITWESTEMTNIGVDVTLFSNLNITGEYFTKRTSDILLELSIPTIVGLAPPYQNAGIVDNKGWELGLDYRGAAKDFKYNVNFNISDVQNKIIDLKGSKSIDGYEVNQEGYAIDSFYGLEALGFFQSDAEASAWAQQFGTVKAGDVKFKDQNGDGKINDNDYLPIGSPIPRFTYSSNLNASYKGLSLGVFLQGVGKANGLLYQQGIMPFWNGGTVQEQHKNYWTPTNTGAAFPRLVWGDTNNQQVSTFWVKDASYLRIKNIQLGYQLPTGIVNKARVKAARVYVNGANLFTFDNFWDGYDVEAPLGRGSEYPQVKVYSFGLDVNF
ncbi:MAG TPA: TonB-dependent receptor [Sphingobacteriaceae bacterium]